MSLPRAPFTVFNSAMLITLAALPSLEAKEPAPAAPAENLSWLLPDESVKRPFAEQVPIRYVSRGANRKLWESLPKFWNETTEESIDPKTGGKIATKAVLIKLPLGLNVPPQTPRENPLTVGKWELGKKLYFDPILCSDLTVSCASCHAPATGYTDQSKVSTGIGGNKGGMSAPTVINSAFSPLQFWDGRAASLEEQCQGPPQNPVEMFDGKGNAWDELVKRVRAHSEYTALFKKEFGHAPTRDAIAKAIATYERTVLAGNSIQDRAEVAMRTRVAEEESTNFTIQAKDYQSVLQEAFKAEDKHSIEALGLNIDKDAGEIPAIAKRLDKGRTLYFGKAKCSNCHIGESFTDGLFHNLGVGVANGKLPADAAGRYGSLPTGHKDPALFGAHKTPPLRALLATKPYMHDGSEATLEAVVDFYDRGGNANPYLDMKMRDVDAEAAYEKAVRTKTPWTGPPVAVFTSDGKPIIPLKLGLTSEEKKDLVLFLRALESDPVDPKVADPKQ